MGAIGCIGLITIIPVQLLTLVGNNYSTYTAATLKHTRIGYLPCARVLWAYITRGKISQGRSPRLIFPRVIDAHNTRGQRWISGLYRSDSIIKQLLWNLIWDTCEALGPGMCTHYKINILSQLENRCVNHLERRYGHISPVVDQKVAIVTLMHCGIIQNRTQYADVLALCHVLSSLCKPLEAMQHTNSLLAHTYVQSYTHVSTAMQNTTCTVMQCKALHHIVQLDFTHGHKWCR